MHTRTFTTLCLVLALTLGFYWGCTPPASSGEKTTETTTKTDSSVVQEPTSKDTGADASVPETPVSETPKSTLSWYKDVQPLVKKHCTGCHARGGIGPFALTTYEEIKARAKAIEWSVKNGRMPPWMPDDKCQPITDTRSMTSDEKKTLLDWLSDGMAKGDPKDAKPWTPKADKLDWVDQTVDIGTDYKPSKQGGRDDYHCFLVDLKLQTDKTIVGFEVTPGFRPIVHHVIVTAVDVAAAKAAGRKEGKGWTCYGGAGVPRGQFQHMIGGWVPGTTVTRFPKKTGMLLRKGAGLVLQIHYNFDNSDSQPDRTGIKLQYAKAPVEYNISIMTIRDGTLSIPPKTDNYTASGVTKAPVAGRIWGAIPHMHALGTSIRVDVDQGDGKDVCLVNIPRWDFNWQQSYFFNLDKGFPVKRGASMKLKCVYNNTTSKTVRWGESTTDEMCLNYLYVSR